MLTLISIILIGWLAEPSDYRQRDPPDWSMARAGSRLGHGRE